jgi:cryptochrome
MAKVEYEAAIHWFRKGLRLHDNPSLTHAIKNSKKVYPIFILDPKIKNFLVCGPNRWRFLLQSLDDLDSSLREHNSRLFVIRGEPLKVLPELIKEWNIKLLTFEYDTEPYAIKRDESVRKKLSSIDVISHVSHTLYDIKNLCANAYPKGIPATYQGFTGLLDKVGPPPKPLDVPDFSRLEILEEKEYQFDQDYDFSVPTLKELDIKEKVDCGVCLFPGGESEALKRLTASMKNKSWVSKFSKPDTEPNSLKPSTTVLSPYLKFGCLSPRKFYYELKEVYAKNTNHTKPPVSLEGQLLWREFFYANAATIENFSQMKGNRICKQINWSKNDEYLNAWKDGRTGYPFIDAIMIQLKLEGWIHHLARHAVACFLTRGDLWQSWEDGLKVFEEYLLDADWSLNAGNWMWLSCSAYFHQYYRVYSPIAFGKKTDPDGLYIKKYLPMLKHFPKKFIYEPWKAPYCLQQECKCIIGKDYPKPIVDHDEAKEINMQQMKEAYKKAK